VSALDPVRLRADFPILATEMRGRPLVYLDSASSAQKPRAVIEATRALYEEGYANVHRGVYQLSERATEAFESVRPRVARFLGAPDPRGVVFTRNVTEAINLVAASYARPRLREGDEILITAMEHHANIVPWQLVCEATGARLRVAPIDDDGALMVDELERLLGPRTRLLAMVHVSNALGTINPVEEVVALARERGIATLVDGAQAAPHDEERGQQDQAEPEAGQVGVHVAPPAGGDEAAREAARCRGTNCAHQFTPASINTL